MDAVRGLRIVRDEIRRRGHEVIEVPGWESRGNGAVLTPKGAVNHWTAGARSGNAPSLNVVTFGRAGLRNALCHTYQDRRATLYLVAARVAWHAGAGSWPGLRGNLDSLGHEPECSGPGDWRPGQLELMADLDIVQADVFDYPHSRIIDHFEWTGRKVDRTDIGGPAWRARLAHRPSAPNPRPTPAPAPPDLMEDDEMNKAQEAILRQAAVDARIARADASKAKAALGRIEKQLGGRNVADDLRRGRLDHRALGRAAGLKVDQNGEAGVDIVS